jgi:hypothetical protein
MTRDDPEYWRIRAKEARLIAGHMSLAEAKQAMLEIPATYERLAEMAQRRSRPPKR